jgi:hypothetical protein
MFQFENSTDREKRIKERERNLGKRKIWHEVRDLKGHVITGVWVYEGDPDYARLFFEQSGALPIEPDGDPYNDSGTNMMQENDDQLPF